MVVRSLMLESVQGLRNCVPEGCNFEPSHAIAWVPCNYVPESSLTALVHANFDLKPSWNSLYPSTTISSQLRPQTRHKTCQKHGIKPSYNQSQNHPKSRNKPKFKIHTNSTLKHSLHTKSTQTLVSSILKSNKVHTKSKLIHKNSYFHTKIHAQREDSILLTSNYTL